MRIENTLKNSGYAIVSYILLSVLSLVVRKVFLETLSIDLLGYEGLFGNIFSLLALADLGLDNIILYKLFPAYTNNDKEEINIIMSVYKTLYIYVGLAVLVVGIMITPILKFIIPDNNLEWKYVYLIYFVQLAITLCTYFLAYKRLLFSVYQNEYVCTRIDTCVHVVSNIVRVTTLFLFRSYLIYLFCNFFSNLISNIIISYEANKKFSYIDWGKKANKKEIQSIGIGKDIKNNIIQKVCITVYGGTDNIVISALLGIGQVGLLANYTMIQGYITTFMLKLLKPFQASIGNYIYDKPLEEGYPLFKMFDFVSFNIACIIATCYLTIFNPFINIWLGNQYCLSMGFVLAFSINQYILWNHQFLTYYRYSFGKYELDRIPALIAAVLNVVLSVILAKPFGMAGIMIGTSVGHLGLWFGRVRVVFSQYIFEKKEQVNYCLTQAKRILLFVCELGFVFFTDKKIPESFVGIIMRVILGCIVPLIINFVIFWKTEEIKYIIYYLNKILKVVRNKNN
ncbi:Membrane protein involved in the export of O-antigen and teichoic acid [Oribacterium sp. KHPX15]|uniref:lipopolysaccharide biosynthesis protein n=1 Tax=Oribacterium sp. KHPX15 TaxID=1855342 RepID=UPI0008949417|nr:hypothetical protein [Oribacterium sp. KHPX15]SEA56482.1 Membrane protein involved in the export of O-antigen and teichoic acid [Oribacterium sp. KHPX15]